MWTYQFAMMQFCAEKHGWTKFISMQSKYSLLHREDEREMNKFCNETGVGLLPVCGHSRYHLKSFVLTNTVQWQPLAAGLLCRPVVGTDGTTRGQAVAGAGLPEDSVEIINRVEELAKRKGWTMTQVTLAWVNKRVSSPIIGFSSEKRIDDAIAAIGKTLAAEEEAYLEEPYKAQTVTGFL